jgi:hypothetical protein
MILRPAVRGPRDRHNALSGRPACAGHSETRLASIRFHTAQKWNTVVEDVSGRTNRQPKLSRTHTLWSLLMAWLMVTTVMLGTATAGPIVIEVAAGKVDRKNVPVSFPLPTELATTTRLFLTHLDSNRQVPCQYEAGPPARLHWMLDDLPQGRTCRFRIEVGNQPDEPRVSVAQTETE